MELSNQEIVLKMFNKWREYSNDAFTDNDNIDNYFTLQEQKLIFLIDNIIGITTYDDSLSLVLGKDLLEVINAIHQRQTFEYIKNEDNYKKYIICVNWIKNWLDWGSSIRGAWFSNYDCKIVFNEPFDNIGLEGNSIEINEEFMNWFVEFLKK